MGKKYVPSGYQIFNLSIENFSDEIKNDELRDYCKRVFNGEDVKPLLIKLYCHELDKNITAFATSVSNKGDLEVIIELGLVNVRNLTKRIGIYKDMSNPEEYPILTTEDITIS